MKALYQIDRRDNTNRKMSGIVWPCLLLLSIHRQKLVLYIVVGPLMKEMCWMSTSPSMECNMMVSYPRNAKKLVSLQNFS